MQSGSQQPVLTTTPDFPGTKHMVPYTYLQANHSLATNKIEERQERRTDGVRKLRARDGFDQNILYGL